MDIDTHGLIQAVTQPLNQGHAILYGLAGTGGNSTITQHHLTTCGCCHEAEAAIQSLRAFALDPNAHEPLLAMPHPVVALAYAVTQPHVEWDPQDPHRYTPPHQHPQAVTATTIWCYTIDGVSYAMRLAPQKPATPIPVGALQEDRTLTALRALVLKLKCALQATPPT